VQGAVNAAATGTTGTLTFANPIAPGNIIVGAMLETGGAIPISITDDKGNQYTFINSGHTLVTPNSVTGFRSLSPLTNGPQPLTFVYQSASIAWLLADEFSAGISLPGLHSACRWTRALTSQVI
jgi:hypothetical protein